MSILILCDHENGQLSPVILNTITAATQIGGDIDILVAGDASGNVVKAAASIANVNKVLSANDDIYEMDLPRTLPLYWKASQPSIRILWHPQPQTAKT